MAKPGFLANNAQLASKINISTLLRDYAHVNSKCVQSKVGIRSFSNSYKTIALTKTYGMSNEIATRKTASNLNLKHIPNLPSKFCFSSAFMSMRPLPQHKTFLAPKTTSYNQEIVTSKVGLQYLHVGCKCRANIIDGRTTDKNTDQQHEEKLVTKIDDIEEKIADQSSTKTDITYKPLNMRAIEDIIENVDRVSAVYLTQYQRKKFLHVLESNLVAIAISEKADMRRKLSDRQRLHIAKTDEEREKIPEYVLTPQLSPANYVKFSEGPDFRLSSIVLPDLMSQSKPHEKVEAQEIFNDRMVKITESSNDSPQEGNANLAVKNNEVNKKSD